LALELVNDPCGPALKLISANPQDAEGWLALSKAFFQKGEFESVKASLNEAIKLEPDLKEAVEAIKGSSR
jgi:cytochrome c-type biogenesis protein CcmH/NrfG